MTGTTDSSSALSQRLRLLRKATLVRKWANKSHRQIEATYNAHHDKRVRLDHTIVPGDFVLIERPPLTTSLADRRAAKGYTKLLPRQLGPFRNISGAPKYGERLQYGIENTVSTSRITKAPRANEKDNEDIVNRGSKANNEDQLSKRKKRKKYAIGRILGH